MNVSRRDLVAAGAFAFGASGLLLSGSAGAQGGDEAAVTQRPYEKRNLKPTGRSWRR
jgi:hypothetical protein